MTVRVGPMAGGFYVEDDGPGLDDSTSVFDRGVTTKETGTGFGLAIVESIVEAHGWSIDTAEAAAGGARFEVTGVDAI